MAESPNHIVQEAESIVNAANVPSANFVETSRANEPSPSEAACPCGCNREEASCLFDEMPDEELLYDLADLFKVFADTTRIKILYALMGWASLRVRQSGSMRSWGTTAASRTSPKSSAPRKAPCRTSYAP